MATPDNYSTATLKDHVGHDFGAGAPVRVDQIRINTFADITGDHQWIHVDVERAKKHSPFGGPVAHGFLSLSLMGSALQDAGIVPGDAKGAINYGLEKIRFIAPVPAGAEVSPRFRLAGVEDRGEGRQLMRVAAQVDIVGSDKPAVLGEVLVLVIA